MPLAIGSGRVRLPNGTAGAPALAFASDGTLGLYRGTASEITLAIVGTRRYAFQNAIFALLNDALVLAFGANSDVILARDAANTLAQRNGVNPQVLRLYNTYTDVSNYERGELRWTGNELQLATANAGTGSARDIGVFSVRHIFLTAGSTSRWQVSSSGHLISLGNRLQLIQGADVASANSLVLGADGNAFEITGSTQINLMNTSAWQNGSIVTLLFTANPTVKHNQAPSGANVAVLLAGAVDFVASAGDTLTLLLSEIGGTQAWREIGRAVI